MKVNDNQNQTLLVNSIANCSKSTKRSGKGFAFQHLSFVALNASIKQNLSVLTLCILIFISFFSLPKLEAAATWSAPVTLSSGSAPDPLPEVSMNANGYAVAVWRFISGTQEIQASTFSGGVWSPAVNVSAPLSIAETPQVAVDDNGNAVAVWTASTGPSLFIQASTLPFGGSWTAPVSFPGILGDFAQVAVDSSTGDAVAVWQGFDGLNFVITSAILPFGGSWSAPVNVTSGASGASLNPQVGIDGSGKAIAVWEELIGVTRVIQSATLPFGGSWTAPVNLSASGPSGLIPQIAVDKNGDAVAVWQESGTGPNIVIQASSYSGGVWSATPDTISLTGQDAFAPDVTIDGQGTATAVWFRSNGTNRIIQAAQLPLGGSWTAPVDISQTGADAFDPRVESDQAGNVIAVWSRSLEVQVATHPLGGSWTTPITISNLPSVLPQVGLDEHGEAVVVWRTTGSVVQAAFGINLFSPEPPQDFTGTLRSNRFVNQKEYINVLTWSASPNSSVIGYYFYIDGALQAFIPSEGPFIIELRSRKRDKIYTYTLVAISSSGFLSDPVSIVLRGG